MEATNNTCCLNIRNVYHTIHDSTTDITKLRADIESKNYKKERCGASAKTERPCLKGIIDDIKEDLNKTKGQVRIHGRQKKTIVEEVTDQDSDNLRVTDPCGIAVDRLVDIRRNIKVKLAELEHHNGKGNKCDEISADFKADEIDWLTSKCFEELTNLRECLIAHNSYCTNEVKGRDIDSGLGEEDASSGEIKRGPDKKSIRHGVVYKYVSGVQETGQMGANEDEETVVKTAAKLDDESA